VPLGDERLLAVTVDCVDEELELLYRDPKTAGRMAVVATLSDLAAVGALPLGILLDVSLPTSVRPDVQERVAEGVRQACDAAHTFVLGGDTSESDRLRISCVGVGTVPASTVTTRVGLRPGDRVFASGPMGMGAALAGVKLLGAGIALEEGDFHPPCRVPHGLSLRGITSACIDSSDGLFAALDQLARLNGVAIELDADLDAMLAPQAREVASALGFGAFPLLASIHGEFELVFGVPNERDDAFQAVQRALGWTPTALGVAVSGRGLSVGACPVDGAKLRNLYRECGGDIRRYVASLVRAGHALRARSTTPR
jgi:thiamine-monophosphate kinase